MFLSVRSRISSKSWRRLRDALRSRQCRGPIHSCHESHSSQCFWPTKFPGLILIWIRECVVPPKMNSQIQRFLDTVRPRAQSAEYETLNESPDKSEPGSDLESVSSTEIHRRSAIEPSVRRTLARLKLAVALLASLLVSVSVTWAGKEFRTERVLVTHESYCETPIFTRNFARELILRELQRIPPRTLSTLSGAHPRFFLPQTKPSYGSLLSSTTIFTKTARLGKDLRTMK